jgi:hypothetical protein
MTRFLASVPGYVYARQGDTIFVNLYAAGTADITLDNKRHVSLTQETRYPWDGKVKLTVAPEKNGRFTLKVRIPGWARNQAVASDLYKFSDPDSAPPTLKINGKDIPLNLEEGYVALKRSWRKGDVVDVDLPMPVRRVIANQQVADDVGKVALQRGPLVYCVEWPDVKDGHVVNLVLSGLTPLTADFHPDLLNGVETVKGQAESLRYVDANKKLGKENIEFTAIPYYAWANRGRGEMAVWLARTESAARPLPYPTIASTSKATASNEGVRPDVRALNDQREPKNSNDHSNRYLHWWPHKGTKEWVQYDFAKAAKVDAVEVYWFDDTGVGECRVPKSWELFYRTNGEWKPVERPSGYGCEADRYNRTTFIPVETDGLRLEVQLPQNFSTGIHEWRVEPATN